MPLFEVQGPDGKTYEVDAPDMQTAAGAFAPAQSQQPQAMGFDSPQARAMTAQNAQAMMGDPDAANYSEQAQAQNALGARSAEAGVVEGAKQLYGGIKQTLGSAQDAYNFLVHGKPFDYDHPIRDASGQLIKRDAGQLDTSANLKATAEEYLRQQTAQEEDRSAGINIPTRNTAAGATQLAAATLGPEAALPRATTLTGGILKTTAGGALGNASMFDADNNGMRNQAINAVAGPLIGAVQGIVPAMKNAVGRMISASPAVNRTAAAFDSATKTLADFRASLAQRTGIPWLRTLEGRVYNSDTQEYYAKQTDKFVEDVSKTLSVPLKPGQSLDSDWNVARAKAESQLSGMKSNASAGWQAGMDQAQKMTPGYVQADNLRNAFVQVQKDSQNTLANGGQQLMNPQFMKALQTKLFAPNGGPRALSTVELIDTLKGLTKAQSSDNAVERAMASNIRAGLETDLDNVAKGGNIDKATQQVLETRANYKDAQDKIRAMQTSAAFKLLGLSSADATADDAVRNLYSMTPSARDNMRKFLETNSPDLLTSLKQAAVKDAVAKAGTVRAAADSQQDLDKLLDGMFDASNGRDVRLSGLWNDKELKTMEGIKNGMRVIANFRPGASGTGTPVGPEDVAINIVARHVPFVARLLTRALTGTKGSQFFTDPEVYSLLTKANRSTTSSPTGMMARAALFDRLQSDYTEDNSK